MLLLLLLGPTGSVCVVCVVCHRAQDGVRGPEPQEAKEQNRDGERPHDASPTGCEAHHAKASRAPTNGSLTGVMCPASVVGSPCVGLIAGPACVAPRAGCGAFAPPPPFLRCFCYPSSPKPLSLTCTCACAPHTHTLPPPPSPSHTHTLYPLPLRPRTHAPFTIIITPHHPRHRLLPLYPRKEFEKHADAQRGYGALRTSFTPLGIPSSSSSTPKPVPRPGGGSAASPMARVGASAIGGGMPTLPPLVG